MCTLEQGTFVSSSSALATKNFRTSTKIISFLFSILLHFNRSDILFDSRMKLSCLKLSNVLIDGCRIQLPKFQDTKLNLEQGYLWEVAGAEEVKLGYGCRVSVEKQTLNNLTSTTHMKTLFRVIFSSRLPNFLGKGVGSSSFFGVGWGSMAPKSGFRTPKAIGLLILF